VKQEEEARDEDVGMAYEDMQASTFIEYRPDKLSHMKCLKPHTDPVTETSTLAATPLPELSYKIHLPKATILEGKLSSLQLETVMYACQQVGPSNVRSLQSIWPAGIICKGFHSDLSKSTAAA
jgi:hypothetical protein